MSRLLSSEVSDGTEIPDDEQGSFKFLLKYTWKLEAQFSDGKLGCLPPEGGNQARSRRVAHIQHAASVLKGLCAPQASPALCWVPRDSIFLKAQASSLLIMRDSFH